MKILYVYRHPSMGFSIGKVFRPIENEMRKYAEVESFYLPYPGFSLLALWKNIRSFQKKINTNQYDIVHITGQDHYLALFVCNAKSVVTVHDLGFYTTIRNKVKKIWRYMLRIIPLKYVDIITFISYKSQIETEKVINIKKYKCYTIHNPVGDEFRFIQHSLNRVYPRILHIGTKENKNLSRTIKALSNFTCHLHIVGKLSESDLSLLKKYNINYSNAYGISDEEILEEYKKCDIVSFPSLYEGFGMPIIEGQTTGRVVITSNISPMKEIAGEGAVLIDPENIESIRNGFMEAISSYEKYVKKGLENASRYSLTVITKQYFELYNRVITQ